MEDFGPEGKYRLQIIMSVRQHTYTSPRDLVARNIANGDIPCYTTTRYVANASYRRLLLSRSNGDAPVLNDSSAFG